MPRNRFIQLWVRSTTQRRALARAWCLICCASFPLGGMCNVKWNAWARSATSSPTYALSKHRPCGFARVGLGRRMGMLASVSATILPSGRLAPATANPTGIPSASTSRLRLTPFLARSVGFLPVFFPPERRLGHAPVHAEPGPVDPFPVVVGPQARLPHRLEDTRRDPFLEAIMGGGTRTKAGGVQSLPLTARAKHEEDGFHAHAVRSTRPAPAEAMRVFVFGKQQSNAFPQIVWDMPLVHDRHIHKRGVVHGCTSCVQLPRNNVSCTQ